MWQRSRPLSLLGQRPKILGSRYIVIHQAAKVVQNIDQEYSSTANVVPTLGHGVAKVDGAPKRFPICSTRVIANSVKPARVAPYPRCRHDREITTVRDLLSPGSSPSRVHLNLREGVRGSAPSGSYASLVPESVWS